MKTKSWYRVMAMLLMLTILVPASMSLYINSRPTFRPVRLVVNMCYGHPQIDIYSCDSGGDLNRCENPKLLIEVYADELPIKLSYKITRAGKYAVLGGTEWRTFIITSRSPDRTEHFGCYYNNKSLDMTKERGF